MNSHKRASPKVNVAKATAAVVRAEAKRVAEQVALGVAAELKQFHERRLLKAIETIGKRLDKRDAQVEETFAKIFKRLEAGDVRFDSQGDEIKTLAARMRDVMDSLNKLPSRVKGIIEASEQHLSYRFDEAVGPIQSAQAGIMSEMGRLKEVHNALQGFGALVARAEATLKPATEGEKPVLENEP